MTKADKGLTAKSLDLISEIIIDIDTSPYPCLELDDCISVLRAERVAKDGGETLPVSSDVNIALVVLPTWFKMLDVGNRHQKEKCALIMSAACSAQASAFCGSLGLPHSMRP